MIDSRGRPLPPDVLERIAAFVGPERGLGAVEQLPLRRLVPDYCEKYIALDLSGTPAAFIVVSPPTHTGAARDAADKTHAVRLALGMPLGDSVLAPVHVGDIDVCSYSITPYCQPMSSNRWLSRWQRFRTAPAVLSWLNRVTRHTSVEVVDLDSQTRLPLHTLMEHRATRGSVHEAATGALEALDRGDWRPRSVVSHNDLWWGNFVHRKPRAPADTPFHVFDWAGASLSGVPFYDLVRIARSLQVGQAQIRNEMRTHCEILRCEQRHIRHYLAAAFGTLACHLGEWPEQQFARAADECLMYAADSVARAQRGAPRVMR